VREICEATVVQLVGDGDCRHRSVTVFRDNEVGFAGARVITLVGVRAVDEED